MTWHQWEALVCIFGGAYLALSAYGWLPGRPDVPADHPLVKRAKWLGLIFIIFGLLQLLLHA
jgi:hypothetical protein